MTTSKGKSCSVVLADVHILESHRPVRREVSPVSGGAAAPS